MYKMLAKYIRTSLNDRNIIYSLLFTVLFLSPTHWFWHWTPAWAYWGGIRIEFWLPKVFVGSILVLILWGISLFGHFWRKSTRGRAAETPHFRPFDLASQREVGLGLLFLIGIGIWTTAVSQVYQANLSVWLQTVTGPAAFALWLYWQRRHLAWKKIWSFVLLGVGMQAVLGWYQVIFQSSLGGYWLLGQPDFSSIHTAKSVLSSAVRVLPYGSTAHPNILAGWLVLGICLWWERLKKLNFAWWLTGLAGLGGLLLATESLAAWTSLGMIGVLLVTREKSERIRKTVRIGILGLGISLVILVTLGPLFPSQVLQSPSWTRRSEQLRSLPHLLQEKPLGWGLLQHPQGFTPGARSRLGPVATHPIHSAGIALGADLGICALFLLITFFVIEQKKHPYFIGAILLLTPIFSLDHFGYSTISGQYLIIFFYVYLFEILSSNKPIKHELGISSSRHLR